MVDHLLFGKKRPREDFLPSNVVKPWCTYLGIPPIVVTSAVRYIALQAIAGVGLFAGFAFARGNHVRS